MHISIRYYSRGVAAKMNNWWLAAFIWVLPEHISNFNPMNICTRSQQVCWRRGEQKQVSCAEHNTTFGVVIFYYYYSSYQTKCAFHAQDWSLDEKKPGSLSFDEQKKQNELHFHGNFLALFCLPFSDLLLNSFEWKIACDRQIAIWMNEILKCNYSERSLWFN